MKHFSFKRSALFLFICLSTIFMSAQDFVWKNGVGLTTTQGNYGTMGVPAASNAPGSRESGVSWTDNAGNFWMLGGKGYDNAGAIDLLNDLWKFDPVANQWTWISGSNTIDQAGSYGTQGLYNPTNTPGARYNAVAWTDYNGHLWLFGGNGYDGVGSMGTLNDLWEYDVPLNQWRWIKGGNQAVQAGVYGQQGTGNLNNTPGSRYSSSSWADGSGNLWLFGGYGCSGSVNTVGDLNDLWKYNLLTNQWTWIRGSNTVDQQGVYGTQGVSAAGNDPGGRAQGMSWADLSGNFWMLGGYGFATGPAADIMSDLWKYNPATNQWAFINGASTNASQGVYGTMGVAAPANKPGARYGSSAWSDGQGGFWLFGGYGFDASNTTPYFMNDLWKYDVAGNLWKWVKGSSAGNQFGTYGTQNVAANINIPGSRGFSSSWKDGSNNLWLFGGTGNGISAYGDLNDTWKFFNCSAGPSVLISGSSATACAGVSTTLTASGAATYTWTGSQVTNTISVAPLGTSDYTVVGTDANQCKDTATFELKILNLPVLNISLTTPTICAGQSTTLSASGASTYTWSTHGQASSETISPTANTTYTVSGTGSNGCIDSTWITQAVSPCVGIENYSANPGILSLYPNPSHGDFTIRTDLYENAELVILNALGQRIFAQTLVATITTLNPGLAKGVYYYQLKRSSKTIGTGRLVMD